MRKIVLFMLLIYSIPIYGADKKTKYSSSIFIGCPYYFLNKMEFNNSFNYGGGLLLSVNFKPFSFSSGIFYSSKNYYTTSFSDTSQINNVSFKLNNLSIPALFKFHLQTKTSKFKLSILTGLIFNVPSNFYSITYYKDNRNDLVREFSVLYRTGISTRIGLEHTRKLNERISFFLNLYSDYKIILDYEESHPTSTFSELTSDRLFVGLNLGFEYEF